MKLLMILCFHRNLGNGSLRIVRQQTVRLHARGGMRVMRMAFAKIICDTPEGGRCTVTYLVTAPKKYIRATKSTRIVTAAASFKY